MKKRILFVETGSGFGGSANVLYNMLAKFDKSRIEPFLVYSRRGTFVEKIKNLNVKSFEMPYKNIESRIIETARAFLWFRRIIIQNQINIVHINTNVISGLPAIIAAKFTGVFCVCHIRQTRKFIRRERLFSNWVDKFIVLNKDALVLHEQYIPKKKLFLIYDGIDLNEFSPTQSSNLEIDKEFNFGSDFIVGLVGRIVQGKGQKEFILSAKNVLDRGVFHKVPYHWRCERRYG